MRASSPRALRVQRPLRPAPLRAPFPRRSSARRPPALPHLPGQGSDGAAEPHPCPRPAPSPRQAPGPAAGGASRGKRALPRPIGASSCGAAAAELPESGASRGPPARRRRPGGRGGGNPAAASHLWVPPRFLFTWPAAGDGESAPSPLPQGSAGCGAAPHRAPPAAGNFPRLAGDSSPFPASEGREGTGGGGKDGQKKLPSEKSCPSVPAARRGSPLAGGAAHPAAPPNPAPAAAPPSGPAAQGRGERLSHLPQRALSSSHSSAPHRGRSSCCYSLGYTWLVHAGRAAFPRRLPSPAPPARR